MTIVVKASAGIKLQILSATISTEARGMGVNFLGSAVNQTRVSHPRRPRGSQSGRDKRCDEGFKHSLTAPGPPRMG